MKKILAFIILLTLSILALAANELYYAGGSNDSGNERCAVIRQPSTRYLWDTVESEFQGAITDANCGIDLTEDSYTKGWYVGDAPASLPTGDYDIIIYDSNATLLDYNDTQLAAFLLSIFDSHTWYVAKDGSDSAGGHTRSSALLTIGQAVTNAVAGDTIIIYPGGYAENVVLTGKPGTILEGTSGYSSKIVPATGYGVTTETGCTLRNLSIEALEATANGRGIYIGNNETDIRVENCHIYGAYDGIAMSNTGVQRITTLNTTIIGQFDAVNISAARQVLFDNCIFLANGTYTDESSRSVIGGGTANFLNCTFRTVRAQNTNDEIGGLWVGLAGEWVLQNCSVYVSQTGTNISDVYGIKTSHSDARCAVDNCVFYVNNTGGGSTYDLYNSSGTLKITSSLYNTTAVSGTITQGGSGWAAAVNAEADTAFTDYAPATAAALADVNDVIVEKIKKYSN